MSSIIHQVNKKTGVTYVYRSESYRDSVTKKPKCRRYYLGRLDPETNTIVPKSEEEGRRNRSSLSGKGTMIPLEIQAEMETLKESLKASEKKYEEIARKEKSEAETIRKLMKMIASMNEVVSKECGEVQK